MEIIAVILVLIFALVSAGDRRRKAAARNGQTPAGPGAAQKPATQKPAGQMSAAERQARLEQLREQQARRAAQKPASVRTALDARLTELKQLAEVALADAPDEGHSLLEDADCAGGSMPHVHAEGQSGLEDEDCAGGSMAHTHTEGVSRTEQARRLSELDTRREAEDADRLFPAAIDAQTLRRAVVMAEVLGKPKAIRTNR